MLASNGVDGDEAAEKAQTILGAFSEAPPFPDVREALERLHGAGIKVQEAGQQCTMIRDVKISSAHLEF